MRLDQFRQLPIMGILRGTEEGVLEPLVATIIDAGLTTIEFAMNTPHAERLIRRAVTMAHGRLTIGAGTVMNAGDLDRALEAGASFIVSPVLVPEVVERCRRDHVPVFPGALTPGEIYTAWSAGATMVKVFPTKMLSPGYFKEIKGPFPDIELLACGGITPENAADYLRSGASAVAFGGSVFQKERLAAGEFETIGERIRALVRAVDAVR